MLVCGRTWSFLPFFSISSLISGYMASLNVGAASLINESWVVFGSSLRLRFRRVAEKRRFRIQQLSGNEQELAPSAKRSESLRQILKQYGISVVSPEENKRLDCKEKHGAAAPSTLIDGSEMNTTEDVSGPNHHNCKEKHDPVPSSVIDDSEMNTTVEVPSLRRHCTTVSTTEDVSGKYHHSLPHLKTGDLFTSLLHALGFCIVCIIGTLHTMISRKTSRGHHHNGSKRTRMRTALSDLNEQLASYEHDTSPEYKVSSAYQEATDEACSKVELEYKRFLLECGLSES